MYMKIEVVRVSGSLVLRLSADQEDQAGKDEIRNASEKLTQLGYKASELNGQLVMELLLDPGKSASETGRSVKYKHPRFSILP